MKIRKPLQSTRRSRFEKLENRNLLASVADQMFEYLEAGEDEFVLSGRAEVRSHDCERARPSEDDRERTGSEELILTISSPGSVPMAAHVEPSSSSSVGTISQQPGTPASATTEPIETNTISEPIAPQETPVTQEPVAAQSQIAAPPIETYQQVAATIQSPASQPAPQSSIFADRDFDFTNRFASADAQQFTDLRFTDAFSSESRLQAERFDGLFAVERTKPAFSEPQAFANVSVGTRFDLAYDHEEVDWLRSQTDRVAKEDFLPMLQDFAPVLANKWSNSVDFALTNLEAFEDVSSDEGSQKSEASALIRLLSDFGLSKDVFASGVVLVAAGVFVRDRHSRNLRHADAKLTTPESV